MMNCGAKPIQSVTSIYINILKQRAFHFYASPSLEYLCRPTVRPYIEIKSNICTYVIKCSTKSISRSAAARRLITVKQGEADRMIYAGYIEDPRKWVLGPAHNSIGGD